MARIHAFRALRPRPELVAEMACPPYDVISTSEARELAKGKPRSFLHVIRPEIGLPPDTDEHEEAVYRQGATALRRFIDDGTLVRDERPSIYVYRLQMGSHVQTGVYACVETEDYETGIIVRHEKTRPDKEDDRLRHILEQRAHAEPVMLSFRGTERIASLLAGIVSGPALVDLTSDDGVRHSLWRSKDTGAVGAAFGEVGSLYVADGHHRCAAAARAARTSVGDPQERSRFPAVLFPMDQMQILAYHRLVRRLPGTAGDFAALLRDRFDARPSSGTGPTTQGWIELYLDGRWLTLRLPASNRPSVADRLDVSRLSEHLLEPLLGISDPRTDPNLSFVGGIRGTKELQRQVDAGAAALGIALCATTMAELIEVSDAGLLMPPKSTWFEPKLRSGLLIHPF